MLLRNRAFAGRSLTRTGVLALAGAVLAWGSASGMDRGTSGHDRAPIASGRPTGMVGADGAREAIRVSLHDRVASVPTLPFRLAPAPHDDWRATAPNGGVQPRGALLPLSGEAARTAA